MHHLIDSYGLFLAVFASMFVLMMVVDYLSRKFDIGILKVFSGDTNNHCKYKEALVEIGPRASDAGAFERLEKRVTELEAELKTRTN